MGILVALVLLPRIFGLRLGDPYRVFVLAPYLVDFIPLSKFKVAYQFMDM